MRIHKHIVGESCVDNATGILGTCTYLDQCPYNNGVNYGKQTICGYDCCNTVSCCPDIKADEKRISSKSSF